MPLFRSLFDRWSNQPQQPNQYPGYWPPAAANPYMNPYQQQMGYPPQMWDRMQAPTCFNSYPAVDPNLGYSPYTRPAYGNPYQQCGEYPAYREVQTLPPYGPEQVVREQPVYEQVTFMRTAPATMQVPMAVTPASQQVSAAPPAAATASFRSNLVTNSPSAVTYRSNTFSSIPLPRPSARSVPQATVPVSTLASSRVVPRNLPTTSSASFLGANTPAQKPLRASFPRRMTTAMPATATLTREQPPQGGSMYPPPEAAPVRPGVRRTLTLPGPQEAPVIKRAQTNIGGSPPASSPISDLIGKVPNVPKLSMDKDFDLP